MFFVGKAVVDDTVAKASFCCDLTMCQGACCTIAGARGAPLLDSEIGEIKKAYPALKEYLSPKSIHTIDRAGLYEGSPGNFATSCVEERECVFVYFEGGIARCGFERAYLEGKTSWRKPLSCHLFPIRIREHSNDGLPRETLHYEQIEECHAGRKQGEERNVALHDFLRDPLVRKYGDAWYAEFLKLCTAKAL